MLKRLIINADDFGLSAGVNRAVEIAWQEGILTQASLISGGEAFEEAVEIAWRNPGLQVGLHLTLVQGTPVLPPEQIPGLVGNDGFFQTTRWLSACAFSLIAVSVNNCGPKSRPRY